MHWITIGLSVYMKVMVSKPNIFNIDIYPLRTYGFGSLGYLHASSTNIKSKTQPKCALVESSILLLRLEDRVTPNQIR